MNIRLHLYRSNVLALKLPTNFFFILGENEPVAKCCFKVLNFY